MTAGVSLKLTTQVLNAAHTLALISILLAATADVLLLRSRPR